MNTKTFYMVDPVTREFDHIYEAQEDPMEPGNYIVNPTISSPSPPPTAGVNQVAILSTEGTWSLQPDYRGQTIYDQTSGATQEVTAIGPVKSGFALTPPPPTLAQAQATQSAIINAARDVAAAADVTASVGGTSYTWQANTRSVALLNGKITLAQNGGALPQVWRTADNINVPITALSDLLSIGDAIGNSVDSAYVKSWTLKSQIEAASTVAKVQAVVW